MCPAAVRLGARKRRPRAQTRKLSIVKEAEVRISQRLVSHGGMGDSDGEEDSDNSGHPRRHPFTFSRVTHRFSVTRSQTGTGKILMYESYGFIGLSESGLVLLF